MLIGIDWGGTKIEGVAMERDGRELLRIREATPRGDYDGCLRLAAIRGALLGGWINVLVTNRGTAEQLVD